MYCYIIYLKFEFGNGFLYIFHFSYIGWVIISLIISLKCYYQIKIRSIDSLIFFSLLFMHEGGRIQEKMNVLIFHKSRTKKIDSPQKILGPESNQQGTPQSTFYSDTKHNFAFRILFSRNFQYYFIKQNELCHTSTISSKGWFIHLFKNK